jgi:hypothetical protein
LAHLIYFAFAIVTLEVELFFDSRHPEDMMTAVYAFLKPQAVQHRRISSNKMFALDVRSNI